jgi:nucleoid DNA-binding protein
MIVPLSIRVLIELRHRRRKKGRNPATGAAKIGVPTKNPW